MDRPEITARRYLDDAILRDCNETAKLWKAAMGVISAAGLQAAGNVVGMLDTAAKEEEDDRKWTNALAVLVIGVALGPVLGLAAKGLLTSAGKVLSNSAEGKALMAGAWRKFQADAVKDVASAAAKDGTKFAADGSKRPPRGRDSDGSLFTIAGEQQAASQLLKNQLDKSVDNAFSNALWAIEDEKSRLATAIDPWAGPISEKLSKNGSVTEYEEAIKAHVFDWYFDERRRHKLWNEKPEVSFNDTVDSLTGFLWTQWWLSRPKVKHYNWGNGWTTSTPHDALGGFADAYMKRGAVREASFRTASSKLVGQLDKNRIANIRYHTSVGNIRGAVNTPQEAEVMNTQMGRYADTYLVALVPSFTRRWPDGYDGLKTLWRH